MAASRIKILPVNMALLVIGVMDLVTTVLWVSSGHATEFNPIMAAFLRLGMPAFVAVKLGTLGAYVGMMEWYRRNRSAQLALAVGRLTLASYVAIYAFSFFCVNGKHFLG